MGMLNCVHKFQVKVIAVPNMLSAWTEVAAEDSDLLICFENCQPHTCKQCASLLRLFFCRVK